MGLVGNYREHAPPLGREQPGRHGWLIPSSPSLLLHHLSALALSKHASRATLIAHPDSLCPPLSPAAWVLGVQLGTNNYFVDSVLQQQVGRSPCLAALCQAEPPHTAEHPSAASLVCTWPL